MMLRGLTITAMLVFATMEPGLEQVDLVKYAVTQGGLFAVVVVLLFFYRRDFKRFQEKDEEKVALLLQIVTNNATVLNSNVEATHRLARAVENLDERRSAQRNS